MADSGGMLERRLYTVASYACHKLAVSIKAIGIEDTIKPLFCPVATRFSAVLNFLWITSLNYSDIAY